MTADKPNLPRVTSRAEWLDARESNTGLGAVAGSEGSSTPTSTDSLNPIGRGHLSKDSSGSCCH